MQRFETAGKTVQNSFLFQVAGKSGARVLKRQDNLCQISFGSKSQKNLVQRFETARNSVLNSVWLLVAGKSGA